MLNVIRYSRSASSRGSERATALAVKRDGAWLKWSYKQYREEVRTVAKAFVKLGLQPRSGSDHNSLSFLHIICTTYTYSVAHLA